MFEYFAGRYFVNEGFMSKVKYDEIFTRMKTVNENLENVETDNHNLLEDNHAALIQLLQNSINEKLGDLAFEYEGLDDEQLKSLVRKQQKLNTVFFNQLIVEGVITPDKLTAELNKFRTYYSLNTPGISRNLKEDFDAILSGFIKTNDYYAKEYAVIALKYILRFVGMQIRFGDSYHTSDYFSERVALQKLVTTQNRYFIGISGEKLVLQRFNDNIENSFVPAKRDTRYGSLFSFLNCISSIFQCIISKEREVVMLDIANVYKFSTILINEKCFVIPIEVEDMNLDIVVGYGEKPNFATISHNV